MHLRFGLLRTSLLLKCFVCFTLFAQEVDVGLHCEDGGVTVEDLHWIVEHTIFDHFALGVFLDVLSVDFSFALNEELMVAFLYDSCSLVTFLVLHLYILVESLMIPIKLT